MLNALTSRAFRIRRASGRCWTPLVLIAHAGGSTHAVSMPNRCGNLRCMMMMTVAACPGGAHPRACMAATSAHAPHACAHGGCVSVHRHRQPCSSNHLASCRTMAAAAADGGGHGQQATSASSHPEPAVQQMEVAQLAEVLYNPALVRGLLCCSDASTLPHYPPCMPRYRAG